MNKLMKFYLLAMLAVFVWVIGGIVAIPADIVLLDDDLRVAPLKMRAITEPNDIQPALGYRAVENSYNPQQQ